MTKVGTTEKLHTRLAKLMILAVKHTVAITLCYLPFLDTSGPFQASERKNAAAYLPSETDDGDWKQAVA